MKNDNLMKKIVNKIVEEFNLEWEYKGYCDNEIFFGGNLDGDKICDYIGDEFDTDCEFEWEVDGGIVMETLIRII